MPPPPKKAFVQIWFKQDNLTSLLFSVMILSYYFDLFPAYARQGLGILLIKFFVMWVQHNTKGVYIVSNSMNMEMEGNY